MTESTDCHPLVLKNVSIVKNGSRLLDSIDLDIDRNENVVVLGPNGSGKTTLIKLLRGDIYPYYDEENPGFISLFGMERWNLFDIRSKMGIVSMDLQNKFHDDTLVRDVIASGFFNSLDVFRNHVLTEEMSKKVDDMAYMMAVDDRLDSTMGVLSLGEARRVLIARALITDPKLLVLDEPMTGLDIVMRSKFRSLFDILIEKGVNIVMITHELTDIPVSIDRVVMVKDGKILYDGKKSDLLDDDHISELYGERIHVECSDGIYRMYLEDPRFSK